MLKQYTYNCSAPTYQSYELIPLQSPRSTVIKISRRTNFDQIEYHLSTTSTSISLNSFFFFFCNDTREIYYLLAYLIPAFFLGG